MKSEFPLQHGVDVIIVLMYWGRTNSYYPDEMMLTIARHLAQLGVTMVIGYHPSVLQDHAYFGKTLVIFSLGKLLSSDKVAPYCWRQRVGLVAPRPHEKGKKLPLPTWPGHEARFVACLPCLLGAWE